MMQAAGHVPHPFATITSSAISDEECTAITAAGSTDQPLVAISLASAVTVFTTVCNRINDTAIDVPAVASTAANEWSRSGKEGTHEHAHPHLDEVWAAHRGPGLPRCARSDGHPLAVFRVSEVVCVRGAGLDLLYQQRPSSGLDVPGVRHPGGQLVFGGGGMGVWRARARRILEENIRHPGGSRCMCCIHRDRHYYSLYARWLGGLGRRVSRHGWQRAFPDEGCGSSCCISLFAEAGCRESVPVRHAAMDARWAPRTRRVGAGSSPRCSRSCMKRSLRSTAGEGLHLLAVSISVRTVRRAHGGSIWLNLNGVKSWSLAVERVASYSRGIWRERGDGLPSWSAGGSGAPVPTSPACPARMRFGARRSRIWRAMPRSSAR